MTEKKEMEEALVWRNRQLANLHGVVSAINKTRDLRKVLRMVAKAAEEVCDGRFSAVYLDDPELRGLRLAARSGLTTGQAHRLAGEMKEVLAPHVLRTGMPLRRRPPVVA